MVKHLISGILASTDATHLSVGRVTRVDIILDVFMAIVVTANQDIAVGKDIEEK